MPWKLLAWIRHLFRENQSETDGTRLEADGGVSTTLYSCGTCKTTFVSTDMIECSKCGGQVTVTPSERDLGFGHNPN